MSCWPPTDADSKTMAVFVHLYTFHQLEVGCRGVGRGEERIWCWTKTTVAFTHSCTCQLEISVEWHKESNAAFCERLRQAGFPPLWLLESAVHLLKSATTSLVKQPKHLSIIHRQMISAFEKLKDLLCHFYQDSWQHKRSMNAQCKKKKKMQKLIPTIIQDELWQKKIINCCLCGKQIWFVLIYLQHSIKDCYKLFGI